MDNKPKQTEPAGITEPLYAERKSKSKVTGKMCNSNHNCKYKEAWERIKPYIKHWTEEGIYGTADFILDEINTIEKELSI